MDQLNERLASLEIEGREEVLAKKSGSDTVASELRIAGEFARRGLRVRMLQDQDRTVLSRSEVKRGGLSLPDLCIWDSSGDLHFLVEVRRISGGTVSFSTRLSDAQLAAGLRYRIGHEPLGAAAWAPGTDYESRRFQEQLVEELIARIVDELHQRERLGCRAGMIEIQMPTSHRHPEPTDNFHRFCYEQLDELSDDAVRMGALAGSGYTALRELGSDACRDFILDSIRQKVDQQKRFPATIRSLPYVVAIDCYEFDILPGTVSGALVGGLCYAGNGISYREWPWGAAGGFRGTPWEGLESQWLVRESDMVRRVWRDNRSVEEPRPRLQFMEPWAATLSGVLIIHQTRDIIQWIPNPWATGNYNKPQFLDLGFHDAPEGGPWSSW